MMGRIAFSTELTGTEWFWMKLVPSSPLKLWVPRLPSNCHPIAGGVLLVPLFRWQKLIQKPYESGDYRGMMLIKAIWRPLKLYYLQTEGNMVICYIKPSPPRFRLIRYVAHEIITTYG
nr:uncharacterized protein LOC113738976 [Coffea arabica]